MRHSCLPLPHAAAVQPLPACYCSLHQKKKHSQHSNEESADIRKPTSAWTNTSCSLTIHLFPLNLNSPKVAFSRGHAWKLTEKTSSRDESASGFLSRSAGCSPMGGRIKL